MYFNFLQMSGFDFSSMESGGPPSPPWDEDSDVLMDFKLDDVTRSVTSSDVDEFLSYSPNSLRLDSDTDDAISSFLKSSSEDKECAALCCLDEDTSLKKLSSVMLWKEFCQSSSDDFSSQGILCTTCDVTIASMDLVSNHICSDSDALFSDEDGSSLSSFSTSSFDREEQKSSSDGQSIWKDVCIASSSLNLTPELIISEQFMCDACNVTFNSLGMLESHVCQENSISVSDEDGSSLASFSSTDEDANLNRHLWKDVCLTVADKDNNKSDDSSKSQVGHCSVCKLVFSSSQKLEAHKLNFAAKVACCHCSKRFANVSKLRIHHRKHSKEKPFQCTCCGKYYTHRNTLVRHQQLYCEPLKAKLNEEVVKETVLEKCEDRLSPSSESNTAEAVKNPKKCLKNSADKGVTSCKICDSEFYDTQSLANHRDYHVGQRTCCCCQKVMGNKSKLMIHHRSHTKELPYACSVCDRSFAEKSTLTKHAATHGERNFRCDLCDKAFVRKDYLAKHALTHRQTYKCSQCSFVCYNRLDIERHVAIHPSV